MVIYTPVFQGIPGSCNYLGTAFATQLVSVWVLDVLCNGIGGPLGVAGTSSTVILFTIVRSQVHVENLLCYNLIKC